MSMPAPDSLHRDGPSGHDPGSSNSELPPLDHVTFGPEASIQWHEEQRQLLGSRIRIWAVLLNMLVTMGLVRVLGFFGAWAKLGLSPKVAMLASCVGLVVTSISVFGSSRSSYERLQMMEVALNLCAAVGIFGWTLGWLSKGYALEAAPSSRLTELLNHGFWVVSPDRTTHFQVGPALISFPVGNLWALTAAIYSLVIPVRKWRSHITVVVLVVISVATILVAAQLNPDLRPYVASNIVSTLFVVSVPGAICLYVGSNSQALRRAAFDAKQAGPYQLTRRLGRGAMGEVYLAEHRLLRRPCAVKLIRPERSASQDWLRRFEHEVQAMAQLNHPNTVEIYDFGRTGDGSFFYAMEYLPGMTLEGLVRKHGPLPPARAVYLLVQVCGALAEAHQKGLVHRDIKPSNIFICERGGVYDVIKLIDFGLVYFQAPGSASAESLQPAARQAGGKGAGVSRKRDADSQSYLSVTGQVLGTPAYMAPEQIEGKQPDARSDIYSVGGVGCFLLTGKPPYDRKTTEELCEAHLGAPLPKLREQLPELSVELEAVILRCLAKHGSLRYPKIDDLAQALRGTVSPGAWDSTAAAAWWRQKTDLKRTDETRSPAR